MSKKRGGGEGGRESYYIALWSLIEIMFQVISNINHLKPNMEGFNSDECVGYASINVILLLLAPYIHYTHS